MATIDGTGNDDTLAGGVDADTITGFEGRDSMTGDAGNDTLNGDYAAASGSAAVTADVYASGTVSADMDRDTLVGGAGDDSYVVDASDLVVEAGGEGHDTLYLVAMVSGYGDGTSYTLADNVEDLVLLGEFEDFGQFFGTFQDNLVTGNALGNHMVGDHGDQTLDGGAGDDTLEGGGGSDTFIVDSSNDVIIEDGAQGDGDSGAGDRVLSSVTWTLGDNLEHLDLTGDAAIDGTGNSLDNDIDGNDGANSLAGGAGNDTLRGYDGVDTLAGGMGDDTYVVDLNDETGAADVLQEAADEGTDTIQLFGAAGAVALAEHFENLDVAGTAAIAATGNAADNIIRVDGSGNDTVDGGTGADDMQGTAGGNDTYLVDDAGDSVSDDEGIDTVQTTVNFNLGTTASGVEHLVFTGTGGAFLTGSSADNSITGGSGNDTLDGGSGADTLTGGAGDDAYVVGSVGDVVVEAADGGTDTVYAILTVALGDHLEHLVLVDGAGVADATGNDVANDITGNASANSLVGNAGDDTLRGGGGNDTLDGSDGVDSLLGGAGDDTYVFGDDGDQFVELAGGGTDTVLSAFSLTLGDNIERATLQDAAHVSATGNALGNLLIGNGGNNLLSGLGAQDILSGGIGNDTLSGGELADVLTGGAGSDMFRFDVVAKGNGQDRVLDFVRGEDKVQLDNAVFTKVGADGNLAGTKFVAGKAALDSGDRIIYQKATGTLYYDPDGTGGKAKIAFADFADGTVLKASDFQVI